VKVRIALATLAGVAMLATVGVATAASASASTTPTTTVSHVIHTPPACAAWQLKATLSGPVKGYYRTDILTLANASPRACTVPAYPGLQLLNSNYRPLPTTTIKVSPWSPVGPQGSVVLFPGQSATATISFAVSWPRYGRDYTGPPFSYGGKAAYLVVTLPSSYMPGQGYLPWWGPQQFTLKIPGGPVRIAQNKLYQAALMGHPFFTR
jgi:hypothetical protein